jgi:hypothetical protein
MEGHTFSMKPHERASRLPFLVDITLSEPSCRALVMRITGDVVVYRRIRRGKPLSDGFLQFIACDEVSASETHVMRKETNVSTCSRFLLALAA